MFPHYYYRQLPQLNGVLLRLIRTQLLFRKTLSCRLTHRKHKDKSVQVSFQLKLNRRLTKCNCNRNRNLKSIQVPFQLKLNLRLTNHKGKDKDKPKDKSIRGSFRRNLQ